MFEAPVLASPEKEEVIPVVENQEDITWQELREHLFVQTVAEKLMDNFLDALSEAGFEDDDLEKFESTVAHFSEEEIKSILSVPQELLPTFTAMYFKKVAKGELQRENLAKAMLEALQARGFTIGYHASPVDIRPLEKNGKMTWGIQGYELDDRDNISMAYYSLDYAHVFRKRNPKYVYVVRVEVGEGTSHKKDTSNNWGRAASLSVIDRFDMRELDERVNEGMKELKKKKEKENGA